jgi:RHS repeat-associated protein
MPYRTAFCIFLIVIQSLVYGEGDLPLSDTDGGSITLVYNAVNVISGDYVESVNDLTILGPEPLIFQRLYSSYDYKKEVLYNGWRHNHISSIVYENDSDGSNATYTELSGRTIKYASGSKSRHRTLKFLEKEAKGYTNLGSGFIGGCTHAKNNILLLNKKDKTILAKNGFGSESFFQSEGKSDSSLNLLYEKKANGNQFDYTYNKKGVLEQVSVSNRAGKVFSWIKFINKDAKKNLCFEAHGSDESRVFYKMQKYREKNSPNDDLYYIGEVHSSLHPSVHYEYSHKKEDFGSYLRIAKKSLPNGRYLKIDYFKKGDDIKWGDSRIDRVRVLRAPAGSDGAPFDIYRFDYIINKKKNEILDGYTAVHDANNHLMHYGYTKEHRIDRVQKFTGNNKSNYALYSLEKYLWDDEGSLTCRYIYDKNSEILAARTFDYDNKGNIIKDSFYGNLQGNSPPIIFKKKQRKPEDNGCNVWATDYRYNDDNLLLEENEPNGKSVRYSYHTETKVLKSKFILENDVIRTRDFYDYDENALVICHIVDDGSSSDRGSLTNVTSRKITRTYNSDVAPIGLPIRVDQLYFDFLKGEEALLNRTLNSYDVKGNLIESSHYNRHDKYLYSHRFNYDAHNNLVLSTTPSGDTIEKGYNENDELSFERGASKDSYKQFHYDFMGRLVHLQEFHSDGTCLSTAYSYDPMGNLLSSVDPFGHKTIFTYDELNRLIKTEKPGFYGDDGQFIKATTSQEYDIFGNITKFTDSSGCVTTKTFNVRGDPLKIYYPDGLEENFVYNMDGTIQKAVEKNGSYSVFTHDCFKRLLKTEHYSKNGEHLFTTSAVYNSFHKIAENDKSGAVTKYCYDSAGFLKSISKNDSLKEFEYDDCHRLVRTREWTSETDFHVTILTYDSIDRIIEERMENAAGKIFRLMQYSYDKHNNKIQIIEHGADEPAITRHYFDSHQKLIKTIDSTGCETHITYDYSSRNKYGQQILETSIVDPSGLKIITRFSVFDKPECIFKKNSIGELIAEKEIYYDAAGNVTCTLEMAMLPDQQLNKIKTKWYYNHLNRLTAIVEASESVDQKTTQFAYNLLGEKILTVKPDGTEIHQTYDSSGRLDSYFASDGSFCYRYEYNVDDQLIKSHDLILNECTCRVYDASSRLQNERLGNGLSVEYAYDRTGRPTLFKIPDGSAVCYEYDGLNLAEVKRISKDKNVLYTHTYISHDLKGNVIEDVSILNGSKTEYSYDLKNRLVSIQGEFFKESVTYDAVGNLNSCRREDFSSAVENTYSYNDLKQIASEKGIVNHEYTHDSLNNCIKKDGHLQECNSLNQLLKTYDQAYQYDKNGNRINDNSNKTYTYDALDRLIKVSLQNEEYHYSYDSFNRRLSKTKKDLSGNVLENFLYLYAGQNEVGAFLNGELTEFRVLGSGKGAELGAAVSLELYDNLYIPVHDHNGNVVQIKQASTGVVKEYYRYSAFGEIHIFDANQKSIVNSEINNPWMYSSKRLDDETGYFNFGRRYYDAKNARWTSPDPLGFDEGPNLYAYVNNRPVSHYDLYGLRMGGIDGFSVNLNGNFTPHGGTNPNVYFNASPLLSMAGQIIQTIASHVIPVPVAREAVMGVAGFIGGQGFSFDSLWQSRESKSLPAAGRISLNNHRNISINGILNWDEGAQQMTNHLVKMLGGQQVYHIYNASRGFMTDISECVLLILGFETDSVRIAREAISGHLEAVGKNGTLDIYAHSMGGLITARALEGLSSDQLSQINVYTFGSARIITDSRLMSSLNIVSVVDPVPFIADPLGCLVGMFSCNNNVQFHKPKNYLLLDHCFEGGTYEVACTKIASDSKLKHGIK